jgi:hypothetical protein
MDESPGFIKLQKEDSNHPIHIIIKLEFLTFYFDSKTHNNNAIQVIKNSIAMY